MEINIKGSVKEIAALIVELQGQRLASGDAEQSKDELHEFYRRMTRAAHSYLGV
ncbi:hypothetical protein [Candidatus Allofournierella excrementavium]|uniref:hypothetical protein n=1 Tax=Candidatus Allofournierella excrementavium TaxID=2838591 RepID=UPI003AB6578F